MVSIKTADVLITEIVNRELFTSAEDGSEIDPNFFMKKSLPRMLEGDIVSLEQAGAAAEKGLQVGLVA